MKKSKQAMTFSFLLGLSLTLSAHANRINGPTDVSMRCLPNNDQSACSEENDAALQSGCITREEYNKLESYGSYAICNSRNTLKGWCACGCFAPGTRIFSKEVTTTKNDYFNISNIVSNMKSYKVYTLDNNSSLSDIKTKSVNIKMTTSGAEKDPLITFITENRQKLTVTKEHAILLSNGNMVAAKNVKNTDKLVQADGKPVGISQIENTIINDNVLNILTDGKTGIEHTLFAEGLVVGDLAWQNNLKVMLNKVAIRK